MHNFLCGESLTHNWCPQLFLLHYFAIKVMFEAFYWKHFSIILYGKSQTVLIISRGECNNAIQQLDKLNLFQAIAFELYSSMARALGL